jgi:ABC-type Fe3+ transport system substrate-binding protein
LPAADLPNSAKLLHRLDPLVDPQRRFLPTTLFMHGINVNTSLLKEADWPHSWADLLSPKYKNKLVLHDISRFGGGLSWFMVGRSVLGDDYFRKLAAQNPRIFARVQEEDSAVVRGERPVATPGRSRVKKDFAGSPITWIVPTDGVFFVPIVSGLIRGAAHPNASKLFLDFLLDPATQRSFAATGDIAVISGVENVIDLDTAKFLGNGFATAADLSAISSSVAAANEILGR